MSKPSPGFRTLRIAVMCCLVDSSAGCYSIAQWREVVEIGTEEGHDRIAVECWHEIGTLNDPPFGVVQTFGALALYPIDVLVSLSMSVSFVFDPNWRVRSGPLGAFVAVVSPGLSVLPMPIRFPHRRSTTVDASQFARLVRAIRAGDGRAELAQFLERDQAVIESLTISSNESRADSATR